MTGGTPPGEPPGRQGQTDRRLHTGRARLAVVNVNKNVPESAVFLLPNRDGRLPGCAENHGGFLVACIIAPRLSDVAAKGRPVLEHFH